MKARDGQNILAEFPGFGRVYHCGDCDFIHFQVGAISITFAPDAYMQLIAMVNTSAAAMETWIEARSREGGSQSAPYERKPE